jgi:hypothetical protein
MLPLCVPFLSKIISIAKFIFIQNGLGMMPHYLNKMLKPPVSGIQGFRSQQEADLKTRTCKNIQKEEEKKKDDGNRNLFLG